MERWKTNDGGEGKIRLTGRGPPGGDPAEARPGFELARAANKDEPWRATWCLS